MLTSAISKSEKYADKVTKMKWIKAKTNREAFILEYRIISSGKWYLLMSLLVCGTQFNGDEWLLVWNRISATLRKSFFLIDVLQLLL